MHLELPEDVAGEEVADPPPLVPPHPIEIPVAHRAALDRAAEMILAAERPLVMLGAAASPSALDRGPGRLRPPHPHPLLHHADGQGHGARRHRALHGHRRALGARLRARGDRARRPDHHHRPRHDREAALHHGRRRPEGDPRQLHPGECGPGLLPARRGGGRRRAEPGAAGRPRGGPAAQGRRAAGVARGHPRAHPGGLPGRAFPAHAAAPRARCPRGHPRGRDRRARQRHVQDLVRAQLPHLGRQHAAARQRVGDHGRGSAVRDDGVDALSGAAGARGLRRRRVHDEQPGAGDGGPAQAEPRCAWSSTTAPTG